MKNFKALACSLVLATFLASTCFSINAYATETDGTTDSSETTSNESDTTTTTNDTTTTGDDTTSGETGDDNTTTTTTTEGDTTTTTTTTTTKLGSLSVGIPASIPQAVDGVYTIDVIVKNDNELEGLRFIRGKVDYTSWDSASPCTTTITIPVAESDDWYTIIAKDVKGNIAFANIYVHCDTTPTPTTSECPEGTSRDENGVCVPLVPSVVVTVAPITVTPIPETQGCPDGYQMNENGDCYTDKPGCPDGYQADANGVCVQTPTVVNKEGCPEGQYIDENGQCVDKIESLPQTGGFDTLMMVFVFGMGITVCSVGVIAYANYKEKQNKND